MTIEQYNEILEDQDFRCAICKTREPGGRNNRFHLDHDHKTEHVRGLLCDKCNRGLGFFNDNLETITAVMKYLAAYLENK